MYLNNCSGKLLYYIEIVAGANTAYFIEIFSGATPNVIIINRNRIDAKPFSHVITIYSTRKYTLLRKYVWKKLLSETPPTPSLFIEIVAMGNPFPPFSLLFVVRCC